MCFVVQKGNILLMKTQIEKFKIQEFFKSIKSLFFSNKKYLIAIQTRPTQIVKLYFLLKKRFLTIF